MPVPSSLQQVLDAKGATLKNWLPTAQRSGSTEELRQKVIQRHNLQDKHAKSNEASGGQGFNPEDAGLDPPSEGDAFAGNSLQTQQTQQGAQPTLPTQSNPAKSKTLSGSEDSEAVNVAEVNARNCAITI